MKTIKLKLHSSIDVITNSSTEIFSTATNYGIENIEMLIRTMVHTLNSSVKYSDVIKCIYIVPDESTHLLGMYAMYLKEYKKDELSEIASLYLDTYDNFRDLGDDLWGENLQDFYKMIGDASDIEKICVEDESFRDYIGKTIEDYNDDHYDYPIQSGYHIVVNDDKYKDLAKAINGILCNYSQTAVYQ